MIQAERIKAILELLNEQGSVSVDDLASRLDVSPMTIRRDLDSCDKEGLLTRCHGGAFIRKASITEVPYSDKSLRNIDEKKRIAERCAMLVKPNDTVYLDAGTTCLEVARKIVDIPGIRVTTNDLTIALYLSTHDIEVYVPGGIIQKSTKSVLGESVTKTIQQMNFTVSFIGTASISNSWEVMTPTMEKMYLKRMIIERSEHSYVVADASKFHHQAMYRIEHLSKVSGLVTTYEFSISEMENIHREGIYIIEA